MVNFAVKSGCWSESYHDLEHLSGQRSERALILLWNSDVSLLNLPQKVTCPGKNADSLFRGNYSRSVGAKSQRDCFNKSAVSCLHNPDDRSLRCTLKTTPTWTTPGALSLTQNPLHLLTSLDFADEAPLERADTWVELKPEEKHRLLHHSGQVLKQSQLYVSMFTKRKTEVRYQFILH